MHFESDFFKCFHNVRFIKVNGSSPSLFSRKLKKDYFSKLCSQNLTFFVEFVFFHEFWVEVLTNIFITAFLSRLTAVALLYFLKSWKTITFTNSLLKIMFPCWIRVISCILSRVLSDVFITEYLSKLKALALLYSHKSWKMITFTNSPNKISIFV